MATSFNKNKSALTVSVVVYYPGGLLKYDLGRDVPLRLEK